MYKGGNKNSLTSISPENGDFDFGNTLGSVGEFGFDGANVKNKSVNTANDERLTSVADEGRPQQSEEIIHADVDVKNNDEAIRVAISSDDVEKTGEIGKAVHELTNKMMVNSIDDPAKLNDEINRLSKVLVGSDGLLSGRKGIKHE